jgi:hypothetical protein
VLVSAQSVIATRFSICGEEAVFAAIELITRSDNCRLKLQGEDLNESDQPEQLKSRFYPLISERMSLLLRTLDGTYSLISLYNLANAAFLHGQLLCRLRNVDDLVECEPARTLAATSLLAHS